MSDKIGGIFACKDMSISGSSNCIVFRYFVIKFSMSSDVHVCCFCFCVLSFEK